MMEHYIELLSPLGAVRSRAMFGGHGLYCDGQFIAIVADGELYLKTDDLSRPEFDRAGCRPFVFESDGKRAEMRYCSVPDEALETPQEMRPWAELALQAALRKPARPKRVKSLRKQSPAKRAKPVVGS